MKYILLAFILVCLSFLLSVWFVYPAQGATYNLTDPITQEKADRVDYWYYKIRTIAADTTGYVTTGNKNAAGYYPIEGVSVACPRHYRLLKTKVHIKGHEFVCDDRYALWVQAKYGDTFDIYFGPNKKNAIRWGRQRLEVAIFN